MQKRISRLYSTIVNLNQFYTYGRGWFQIFFSLISIMGSIAVLIIYFNIPQTPELLLTSASIFIVFTIVLGAIMFRTRAQQVDRIMGSWRNPIGNL